MESLAKEDERWLYPTKKGQKNVNRKRSNIESLGENNGQKEKYLPKSDQYLFSFFITHRTPQYYI